MSCVTCSARSSPLAATSEPSSSPIFSQPDRFEEDLGISRLRVRPPARPPVPKPSPPATEVPDAAELERRRLRGLAWTAELRRSLG
jgi:hypothetical protein